MMSSETFDDLRTNLKFGEGTPNAIVATPAVVEILDGQEGVNELMRKFANFEGWSDDLDPAGDHDMGDIPFRDRLIRFRIAPQDEECSAYVVTFHLPHED